MLSLPARLSWISASDIDMFIEMGIIGRIVTWGSFIAQFVF